MLRLHWSYQYSLERCTSLPLLVNHFWTHQPSGLVAVCWIFTYTKTGLKLNYFINGCTDTFIRASHLYCDNCSCNLFEKRFNYGIFKTLLKFIWPVPATGINYLWLSFCFFSSLSMFLNDACNISHHQTSSSVMLWICNRWWMYYQLGDVMHNGYVLAERAMP